MGKHFLLLLLGLSLVVGFLQALTCLECDLLNADGVCEEGKSTCEANDDQKCGILIVSKGHDIWFGKQDCFSRCFNQTFTYYNITVDFTCCHDQSLCNEF